MKKQFDCSIGEPWSSAVRALEAYTGEMRGAPVHDIARICNKHGPLMVGITKRLPKRTTPRIFQGGGTTNLPYTAPELAQVLLKALEKSCRTEVQLAPVELLETTAQFASLVSSELAVCQLAELLDEAVNEQASFLEELAVADSSERINAHLHHLTEVMKSFSSELTYLYPEWHALLHHTLFLKKVGLLTLHSSAFVSKMLSNHDPLLSPITRLAVTGEALGRAAKACNEKAISLMRFDSGFDTVKRPTALREKKSMIGLLGTMQPGSNNLLMPSEARRRKRIDQKLARRRVLGGGANSSDEDIQKEKGVIEQQYAAHAQCTKCQNIYRDDSVYCRMCGQKRPDPPFASQLHVKNAGPPPLKTFGRDVGSVEEEQQDKDFINSILGPRDAEGGGDNE